MKKHKNTEETLKRSLGILIFARRDCWFYSSRLLFFLV